MSLLWSGPLGTGCSGMTSRHNCDLIILAISIKADHSENSQGLGYWQMDRGRLLFSTYRLRLRSGSGCAGARRDDEFSSAQRWLPQPSLFDR